MPDPLAGSTGSQPVASSPENTIIEVRRAYDKLREQIHKVIIGLDNGNDAADYRRGSIFLARIEGLVENYEDYRVSRQ